MTKLINGIFGVLKFILLLIAFGLTFYIIMFMYKRLEKGFLEALGVFAPYLILLFIFMINYIFEQKQVTNNLFYNFTCCLVFATLIFVGYRAIADNYMIMAEKMGYNISFNYFSDIVAPMNSMIYLLLASNVLLMFTKEKKVIVNAESEKTVDSVEKPTKKSTKTSKK